MVAKYLQTALIQLDKGTQQAQMRAKCCVLFSGFCLVCACACIWLMSTWRCRKWSGGYATRSTVARFAKLWLWWTPCPNAQTIHQL